jgi:hypothetical protein
MLIQGSPLAIPMENVGRHQFVNAFPVLIAWTNRLGRVRFLKNPLESSSPQPDRFSLLNSQPALIHSLKR